MILAIICARMASTRLPGKSMLTLAGVPLIEHVINRVKATTLPMDVIVATTEDASDDVLAAHVESLNVPVYRGSSTDVLGRMYWAAERYPKADVIIRVTADDAFKAPELIDMAVECFLSEWATPKGDIEPPQLMHLGGITWALGMDVEVMTRTALTQAFKHATYSAEREHVTSWIAREFGVWVLKDPKSRSTINTRLSIDTLEDYSLALKLYEKLGPKEYSYDATLKALNELAVAA